MITKKVCYTSTLYTLLLYLLYCDDKDLDETLYILDTSFPKDYEKRLRYSCKLPSIKTRYRIDVWKDWLFFRIFYLIKLPNLAHNVEYYIQDHKYAAKILVGNRPYTLIEDSPGVCSRYFENFYGKQMILTRKKWNFSIFRKLYGPLYGYHFGCSQQCNRLLLTKDDKHPYLDGKKRIILPKIDEALWNSLSEYKKKRILEIYDVTQDDINTICNKKYLLLTDPVWPDDAPYEEHHRVFRDVIAKYPQEDLIIKTHPRDINYPYEREFPGIIIFRKPIPMEIFKLIGVNFSTIITLFSTSVSQYDGVNIDWYGTEVSDYCYRHYGHIVPPVKVNEKSI